MTQKEIPIDTRSLFKPLNDQLLTLLKSLNPDDWNKQTVAKQWKVKDVAGHILDGQLRVLSIQRDRYFGEAPPESPDYASLVAWLNQLNAEWVKATKRLSPGVIIMILEAIGDQVNEYYASLDPWEEAIFAVSWAGESTSYNWMHLAREYTEYWHHQQQIRDAVSQQAIMTGTFFYPVMDTFFQALPYTFRNIPAPEGTVIQTSIDSDIGGTWTLIKSAADWQLVKDSPAPPTTMVTIPANIAWVLFSKSLRPHEVMDQIQISGTVELGKKVLEMVAVMA